MQIKKKSARHEMEKLAVKEMALKWNNVEKIN